MQGDNLKNIEQAIQSLAQAMKLNGLVSSTEIGTIVSYAGATAPNGWLICDGSAISRTLYADLFGIVGTLYGAGDGSTTFNLPNLKGKNPMGYDVAQTEFNTLGKTGGEKTHVQTLAELAAHTHNLGKHGTSIAGYGHPDGVANTSSGDFISGSTGSSTAFNVLDPYVTTNFIIRFSRPVYSQSSMALADLLTIARQNDTTNTSGQMRIETGYGVITQTAVNAVAETVTFSKPFTAAPLVLISCMGADYASAVVPVSGARVKSALAWADAITGTNFRAGVDSRDGTNFTNALFAHYSWIAIGS